jgi:hypothetical protein
MMEFYSARKSKITISRKMGGTGAMFSLTWLHLTGAR